LKRTSLVLTLMITICASSVLVGTIQAQSTVDITLYAGPVSSGAADTYGFGYTADNITSPGPTLTLHDGDTVTVTLHNVDKTLSHSFAVTTGKSDSATVLFNSETNLGTFVAPGATATVTFTVTDNVGSYYYMCEVPGHVDLGMWGQCNIEAAVPEFSLLFTPILALMIAGALAVCLKHSKTKITQIF
jgi:uncharacterized cupredoxin-like copper-binding protein